MIEVLANVFLVLGIGFVALLVLILALTAKARLSKAHLVDSCVRKPARWDPLEMDDAIRIGLLGGFCILVSWGLPRLDDTIGGPTRTPEKTFDRWKKALVARDVERIADVTGFSSEQQKEHFILASRFNYKLCDLVDALESHYGPLPDESYQAKLRDGIRAREQTVSQISFGDAVTTDEVIADQECLVLEFETANANLPDTTLPNTVSVTLVKIGGRWLMKSEEKDYLRMDRVLESDRALLDRVQTMPSLIGKPGYTAHEILGELFDWNEEP